MSAENTDAKYWNCALVTARNGFTCASVAPHSGVSVPPVAAGFIKGATVGWAAGAVVGLATAAAVGAAAAVVGCAAGAVVGFGAAGAAVGAGGAGCAHAWSRAAAPPRTVSRRSWRRENIWRPSSLTQSGAK